MKRITIALLALVAILIAVTSRSEEQTSVRSVEATETAVSTTVGITLGKEVTPVKSTVSPEYTKSETKPTTEVTTSIRTEVETTTKTEYPIQGCSNKTSKFLWRYFLSKEKKIKMLSHTYHTNISL